jgi:Rps23 Pro-64 3,4-dihydroxylase Tpa1-like proline 4-hydroxylase
MGVPEQFFFSRSGLSVWADSVRDAYARAQPFAHAVLDGFFPDDVAARIIDEFPPLDAARWHGSGVRNPQRRFKHMSTDEESFSPYIRQVLYQLNARPFLEFVESVTGIAPLLPDPDIGHTLRHFERGGCLGVHTDFNWHKGLELHRRVNLIVYLNRDWRDEYGGHLELWDDDMTRCVKRIAPVANRGVLFATNDHTPHGFPDPLACPADDTRKTIQMYYYTSRIPSAELTPPHRTIFRRRPDEPAQSAGAAQSGWRTWMRDVTPPILYRKLGSLYRSLRA